MPAQLIFNLIILAPARFTRFDSSPMTTLSIKPQLFFRATVPLMFLLFFSGASKDFAALEINIKNCRSDEREYLSELSVTKGNKRISLLKPEHNYTQRLSNLE